MYFRAKKKLTRHGTEWLKIYWQLKEPLTAAVQKNPASLIRMKPTIIRKHITSFFLTTNLVAILKEILLLF